MAAMAWLFGGREGQGLTLLWRGRDAAVFANCVRALREKGIFLERTRARGYEAVPPSLERHALFSIPRFEIRVLAQDLARARQVLQQLLHPPATL